MIVASSALCRRVLFPLLLAALLPCLAGCADMDDDDDDGAFGQAIGVFGMAAGALTNNSDLMMQGAQVYDTANGNSNSSVTPRGAAGNSYSSPTNATQGGNTNAVVNACRSRAEAKYTSPGQLSFYQSAGCLDYCVWKHTGDQQLFQMYQENQHNADNLCTLGKSCNNKIDQNYCQ